MFSVSVSDGQGTVAPTPAIPRESYDFCQISGSCPVLQCNVVMLLQDEYERGECGFVKLTPSVKMFKACIPMPMLQLKQEKK